VSKTNSSKWPLGVVGAASCALLGLLGLLWPGRPLTNWSYDLLFALRSTVVPDEVVIVYMDDESHRELKQPWFQKWDRELHARLIDKLKAGGARTIAFDVLFDLPDTNNPSADHRLVEAARSHGKVIMAAKMTSVVVDGQVVMQTPTPPFDELRAVVVWGLAEGSGDDRTVRLHSPGLPTIKSLAWKVAETTRATLPSRPPQERWLNYYGPPGTIPWVSYHHVLEENTISAGAFSNKIVYVGAIYDIGFTGGKGSDDFRTPYSLWTGRRSAGVEINATACLNLLRHDWLVRMSPWAEVLLITLFGAAAGYGFTFVRPVGAPSLGALFIALVFVASSLLAWRSQIVVSWLAVCGLQIPFAALWSAFSNTKRLAVEKEALQNLLNAEKSASAVPVVQFTITSSVAPIPCRSAQITVWAHPEKDLAEVLRRAREARFGTEIISLPRPSRSQATDTRLSVRLSVEGLTKHDLEGTVVWNGSIASAKFVIDVPSHVTAETKRGFATIYVSGLKVATLHFVVDLSKDSSAAENLVAVQKRPRRAFACYASADRNEVLARIQGMQKAMPELEVFIDVVSLRAGQDWERELRKAIQSCDCLYLFWPANARASKEVEKEWRCALEERGVDFIDPVPLVAPEEVPPPTELGGIHFNDWTLAFRRGTGLHARTFQPLP